MGLNAPHVPSADSVLAIATSFSRYARALLSAEPDLASRVDLTRAFTDRAMRDRLRVLLSASNGLARALRRLRKEVMLTVIARDLAGLASLDEVVAVTSALAEVAIEAAVDGVHAELVREYGEPREATGKAQRLHVVGMGKLGGGELNVSSDIDLVLLYPEEGETDGARPTSNHEFFVRAARKINALLSEMTEDGYVFRVDLRLRPYGDSGPLVASFEMLETYLITQGREWERYAWIKGRTLTGDRGTELMDLVRPFVFRRHLDFSAFASMRELHRQIRAEVERRDIADNIKLGPGGIREIEFIVQLFQLIRGGRDAALRRQPTLAVLPALAERRLLPEETVRELTDAYVFLRDLEHRLQYLDDQQTHALPRAAADRELVAKSMGAQDYEEFTGRLERYRANVTRHFNGIFATTDRDADDEMQVLVQDTASIGNTERVGQLLAKLRYGDPQEVQRRLAALRGSPRYRQMPAASQARLEKLLPRVVETAAVHENRDVTLTRMLQLLEAVSRREAYLALLEQYPQALARVAEVMSASPWAADYLTQHPILLDELLETRTLYEEPNWPALTSELRAALDDVPDDVERQMDLLRHFKHVQTMRLLAQDLAGTLPLERLSDHLSDLASKILEEVVRAVWRSLRQRHRERPAFAVIGYGKLGGKELGYASDLDLVFLYDDPAPEAAENYGRLVRRTNQWLTSFTSAGVLYETDLRLRPEGEGGLLVSPFASFREYQLQHAWPWEHQALTRSRFEAGDAGIGSRFEALRIEVLRKPRELGALRAAVVEMREKMFAGHPNTSGRFDLKHDRGGIVDVEFIVQYLVLGFSHAHEELTGNLGNLALLKIAARLGLIPEAAALHAHDAYRRFRQLQHALRLQGERYARIETATVQAEADAVRALWALVLG